MTTQAGKDEEKPVTELRDLFVKEVSLVDAPANGRKFLLYKSATGTGGPPMPELTEAEARELEDLLNEPHPKEAEVLKAVEADLGKALDASARNKVTAALRLLNGIEDADVAKLVKVLSGLVGGGDVKTATAKAEPPAKKQPEPAPATKAAAPAVLPAEVVALAKAGDYEAVVKAAGEAPGLVGLLVDLLKSRDGAIADLTQWQAQMIAKADDAEVRSLVTSAGLPGMSIEDQCKLVKSMNPEGRKAWAAHAEGLRANLALSGQTGTSRRGPDAYNPLEEINRRVAERVAKGDGKTPESQHQLDVLNEDPKLAADYRAWTRGESV